VRNFGHDLESSRNELDATTRRLADHLKLRQAFEDEYDQLGSMMNDREARIKDFSLRTTLDEKLDQCNHFTVSARLSLLGAAGAARIRCE